MADAISPTRLAQLRQRWERDPSSRLFLQLAEEYRRAGDLLESIRVLEAGLRRQPSYLSAQVALGRCYLENGQATQACRVLEAVVGQDPTQLVAQKLLVEAYLQVGEAAKARSSLDLYRLFNNRDQEIEKLERRIRGLSGEIVRPAAVVEPPARPAPPPIAEPIFDLGPVDLPMPAAFEPPPRAASPLPAPPFESSPRLREPFGTIHEPQAAGRAILARFALEEIFAVGAIGSAAAAVAVESQPFFEDTAVDWQPDSEILRGADELAWISSSTVEPPPAATSESALPESRAALEFEPASETAIDREPAVSAWEPTVEPETLYGEEAAPPVEEPAAAGSALPAPAEIPTAAPVDWTAEPESEPSAPVTEAQPAGEETVFAPVAGTVDRVRIGVGVPTISLPLPTLQPAAPEAETPEPTMPEPATPEPHSTTLGELYLAQGHIAEARTHFEAVISEQPSAEAARRGLFQTLEPAAAAPAATESLGLTQRKVMALRGYLDRLRRVVRDRVS
jgi:Tfp pilus assembly protein PilF